MAINLLELMQTAIGNQMVGRMAGIIGEDNSGAQKAVGAILPSVLGGLIGKSLTSDGADQLAGVLGQADGTIIDNLDKILDGADGGADRLASMGEGLVSGLLGDKLGGVLDIISKTSGIGKAGSGSLMNLVVPLIFSVLGKQTSSLGLTPAGIAKLLADQSGFLKGLLPTGMSSLLGLGDEFDAPDGLLDGAISAVGGIATDAKENLANAGDVAGDAKDAIIGSANAVGNTVSNVADSAKDAVTGAADAIGDTASNVVDGAKETVTGAAGAVGDGIGNAAEATTDAVKKGGGFLKVFFPLILLAGLALLAFKFVPPLLNKGGTGTLKTPAIADISASNALDSINGVLGETTSAFKGISDEASAKDAIPKIDALTNKVNKIAGLPLPAGVKTSIGTAIKGNSGKLEKALSKAYSIPGVEKIIDPKVEELQNALTQFIE